MINQESSTGDGDAKKRKGIQYITNMDKSNSIPLLDTEFLGIYCLFFS